MSDTPRTDAIERAATDATGAVTRMEPIWEGLQALERELNAAKTVIESLEDALIEIEASLYEDESENAAGDACWHVARKALKKLKEHNQ